MRDEATNSDGHWHSIKWALLFEGFSEASVIILGAFLKQQVGSAIFSAVFRGFCNYLGCVVEEEILLLFYLASRSPRAGKVYGKDIGVV
ncbi:hypothetical protein SUGI_0735420 [Cryptomeria japonica]|nr:hypothetical protein SUGI_0735420 [Cryptomeria japonica]